MELQVQSKKHKPDAWLVVPKGSIDSLTSGEFHEKLLALLGEGDSYLLLDLRKVKYMSSSGVGILFDLHRRLSERGGALFVYAPQTGVRRVLEIVKLESRELRRGQNDSANPYYDLVEGLEEEKARREEAEREAQASKAKPK